MLHRLVAAAGIRAVARPHTVLWRCGGGPRSGVAEIGVRTLGTAQQVNGEAKPLVLADGGGDCTGRDDAIGARQPAVGGNSWEIWWRREQGARFGLSWCMRRGAGPTGVKGQLQWRPHPGRV